MNEFPKLKKKDFVIGVPSRVRLQGKGKAMSPGGQESGPRKPSGGRDDVCAVLSCLFLLLFMSRSCALLLYFSSYPSSFLCFFLHKERWPPLLWTELIFQLLPWNRQYSNAPLQNPRRRNLMSTTLVPGPSWPVSIARRSGSFSINMAQWLLRVMAVVREEGCDRCHPENLKGDFRIEPPHLLSSNHIPSRNDHSAKSYLDMIAGRNDICLRNVWCQLPCILNVDLIFKN